MTRRHHTILGALAALSLCLCGFAVYRLPHAYGEAMVFKRDAYGGEYVPSGEYREPPAARAEAWAAVIVTAALPLAWLSARCVSLWRIQRGRARAQSGRCPACGYDVRATRERCPECGTATATVTASSEASRP